MNREALLHKTINNREHNSLDYKVIIIINIEQCVTDHGFILNVCENKLTLPKFLSFFQINKKCKIYRKTSCKSQSNEENFKQVFHFIFSQNFRAFNSKLDWNSFDLFMVEYFNQSCQFTIKIFLRNKCYYHVPPVFCQHTKQHDITEHRKKSLLINGKFPQWFPK